MPTPLLPTINNLAFVTYSGARIVFDRYYVTGQPSAFAYPAMPEAGIRSVICVRQPGEAHKPPPHPPPPPFDTTEASTLQRLGVSYQNIPITRTMTQPEFDAAATQAANALLRNGAAGPALIHCSTGDRASSVFAVMLILGAGWTNADAADYCINALLLANSSMVALVRGYSAPPGTGPEIDKAAADFKRLLG